MMADMPPNGNSAFPPIHSPMPPPRRGISFDRGYVFSFPGILTWISMILAFIAMIAIEVAKTNWSHTKLSWPSSCAFHEFAVVTSWITLLLFNIIAGLGLHRLISIRPGAMKFAMVGLTMTWAIMTLISSAIALDFAATADAAAPGHPSIVNSKPAIDAAGAFGLLEFFSLAGATTFLALDLLNVRSEPLFEY